MNPFTTRGVIPFAMLAALLLASCTDENLVATDAAVPESEAAFAKWGRTEAGVAIPFKADFKTVGGIDPTDDSCGDPPRFLNVQDGSGQATHLGRFDVHITFCVDVTDLGDGMLEEGESIPYDSGVGTLTAANGDVLTFTISGAVLPSDHPDYDFEFADAFQFTGGTGRFLGASGSGITHSFVDFATQTTEHYWTATLTR